MDVTERFGALLGMILKRPGHLRTGLQAIYESYEMDLRRGHVIDEYEMPKGLPTVSILDILPGLEEKVAPYSFLYGMSPPLDIALLNGLARKFKDCSYLEIGSWRGESLANVAGIARECISVSLSSEEMRSFGMTDNEIATSGFFTKGLANVTHIGHNSQTLDWTPYRGKFDLVFVDGDHSYEGVKIDTKNAFSLLRDDSSILVWHDYGLTPETVNWRVLAGILDACPPERRRSLYHVSNTVCAIYSSKPLEAKPLEFSAPPTKKFSVAIKGERL